VYGWPGLNPQKTDLGSSAKNNFWQVDFSVLFIISLSENIISVIFLGFDAREGTQRMLNLIRLDRKIPEATVSFVMSVCLPSSIRLHGITRLSQDGFL
jgi:hypothetical protein